MSGRVLLLSQRTDFCRFAAGQLRHKFGERLQHEEIRTVAEGRNAVGADIKRPAVLIWGNGRNHQLSNSLNVPGSLKLVFDRHSDNACSLSGLNCENHNDASIREGVAVDVCYELVNRHPRYSVLSGIPHIGVLHVSIDLDFVKGFPALPYMSVGNTEFSSLCSSLEGIIEGIITTRFDIGGYSEMTDDFEGVYSRYYEKPMEVVFSAMLLKKAGP